MNNTLNQRLKLETDLLHFINNYANFKEKQLSKELLNELKKNTKNIKKGLVKMEKEKKYFTTKEAFEDIMEYLEQVNDSISFHDIHHEVFNTDYYIVGTFEARKALDRYGVFDAIELVKQYEMDNFDQLYTEVENPEALANMLYYIVGEDAVNDLIHEFGEYIDTTDEEQLKDVLDWLDVQIK